jgi:hypothetical protein
MKETQVENVFNSTSRFAVWPKSVLTKQIKAIKEFIGPDNGANARIPLYLGTIAISSAPPRVVVWPQQRTEINFESGDRPKVRIVVSATLKDFHEQLLDASRGHIDQSSEKFLSKRLSELRDEEIVGPMVMPNLVGSVTATFQKVC